MKFTLLVAGLFAFLWWWGASTAQAYDCNGLIPPEVVADPYLGSEYFEKCGGDLSQFFRAPNAPMPPTFQQPHRGYVGFNPNTREMFVNGYRFHADDDEAWVKSRQALDWRPTELPYEYTIAVTPEEYKSRFRKAKERLKMNFLERAYDDATRYLRNSARRTQNENDQMKKRVRLHMDRCWAVAERKYTYANPDMMRRYANECIDQIIP